MSLGIFFSYLRSYITKDIYNKHTEDPLLLVKTANIIECEEYEYNLIPNKEKDYHLIKIIYRYDENKLLNNSNDNVIDGARSSTKKKETIKPLKYEEILKNSKEMKGKKISLISKSVNTSQFTNSASN